MQAWQRGCDDDGDHVTSLMHGVLLIHKFSDGWAKTEVHCESVGLAMQIISKQDSCKQNLGLIAHITGLSTYVNEVHSVSGATK